jgi:ligand-binding sensor domain-containing protein
MWLGTYGGGLARVRADRITSVTTKQGLFDNAISAIVPGDQDDVWVLGNRGVFATRWADLDAVADGATTTLDGATFGPADGVPEGNGGHPAAARLDRERIAFASVRGLVLFDPRRLRPASPPAVLVEDVLGGIPAA